MKVVIKDTKINNLSNSESNVKSVIHMELTL